MRDFCSPVGLRLLSWMSQRWDDLTPVRVMMKVKGENESQGLTMPVKSLCCHKEHEKNTDGNDEN